MNGTRHPFTGYLYEQTGDGRIRVSDGTRSGIFGKDGHWIEGEILEADPQLCGWVGGPIIGNHRLTPSPTQ
jgi:hypothetical protein